MAELVDATAPGAVGRKPVWVRVPPSASITRALAKGGDEGKPEGAKLHRLPER